MPPASKAPGADQCDLVEVSFKGRRKHTYRNSRALPVVVGDYIVVSAQRGLDLGRITMAGTLVRLRKAPSKGQGYVLRVASKKDMVRHHSNREQEGEALTTARTAAERRRLSITFVDAEWQFDRKRISLFYTASNRVKVTHLVKDLRRQFKARVDVRRINPRQEAARIGGIGTCGRELCCSSWMHKMPPVQVASLKKQGLPASDERLVGRCGQLKCCINYELEAYMEALKEFPTARSRVQTEHGRGRVLNVNIFTREVHVRCEDGSQHYLPVEAVRRVRGGRTA